MAVSQFAVRLRIAAVFMIYWRPPALRVRRTCRDGIWGGGRRPPHPGEIVLSGL